MGTPDRGELIVAVAMFSDTMRSVNETTKILTEAAYTVAANAEDRIDDLETEADLYRALGKAIVNQIPLDIEEALADIAEAGV